MQWYFYSLIAAGFIGIYLYVCKLAYNEGIKPDIFLCGVTMIMATLYVTICATRYEKIDIQPKVVVYIFICGLCAFLSTYFDGIAISKANPGMCRMITSSSIVIVMVICHFSMGDSISPKQMAGALLVLMGIFTITT